jgi:hypothetical protein
MRCDVSLTFCYGNTTVQQTGDVLASDPNMLVLLEYPNLQSIGILYRKVCANSQKYE